MSADDHKDLLNHAPVRDLDPNEVDALAERVEDAWQRHRARSARRTTMAQLAVAALCVIAVGLAWWGSGPPPVEVAPAPQVADLAPRSPDEDLEEDDRVLASADAVYRVVGPREDRVVALEQGTVHCDVTTRAAGERFRVMADGGYVEVVGTSFEVTAKDGRLTAVLVEHGRVEVHLDGADTVVLGAGERWPAVAAPRPPGRPVPEVRPVDPPPPPSPEPESAVGVDLIRGLDALDRGALSEAVQAFDAESARFLLREDALFWRAVALLRQERPEDARSTLVSLLSTYPTTARAGEAHCLLAGVLYRAGESEEARVHFGAAGASPSAAAARCGRDGLEALNR